MSPRSLPRVAGGRQWHPAAASEPFLLSVEGAVEPSRVCAGLWGGAAATALTERPGRGGRRFCGLVQFPGGVRRKVLLQLLLLLCHPFPVVSVQRSGFCDPGATARTSGWGVLWCGDSRAHGGSREGRGDEGAPVPCVPSGGPGCQPWVGLQPEGSAESFQ